MLLRKALGKYFRTMNHDEIALGKYLRTMNHDEMLIMVHPQSWWNAAKLTEVEADLS